MSGGGLAAVKDGIHASSLDGHASCIFSASLHTTRDTRIRMSFDTHMYDIKSREILVICIGEVTKSVFRARLRPCPSIAWTWFGPKDRRYSDAPVSVA